MICPICSEDNDRVIDSRAAEGGLVIRRRRECLECGRRYTTYERVERTARLMVVKKDGSRVAFDQQNVLNGLQLACGKRPVSEECKLQLAREIEDELHREFDREVPSAEIGKRVALRLREIDEIAYIRYASEYYEYRSLDELAAELRDLRSRPREVPGQVRMFSDRE